MLRSLVGSEMCIRDRNSRTYNLGMSFVKGVANPEVEKYSGDIIYVDNRASVTRSSQQKEDIKIVLEF